MTTDNPLAINTKVMTGPLGLGTVIGFVKEDKGWKYSVDFGYGFKCWVFEDSVRKATWLEILLYG